MKCSCNCNKDLQDQNEVIEVCCPLCSNPSKQVSNTVTKTLLKKELKKNVTENDYFLCTQPDCNISYFSSDLQQLFFQNDLNRPLWFKKNVNPIIACYCNNITDVMIKDAVKNHELLSWENIVSFYRKKTFCACEKLNPTGECCTPVFYETINEALKEIGKEPIEIPDNCCEE